MKVQQYNWLLLRGLATEQAQWSRFKTMIEGEADKKDVLCLDIPGAGDHFQEKSPLSIDHYVYFLREKFLAKKKEGPYALVAISMGAMIGMRWKELFPKDFEKSIFLNTSSKDIAPFYKRAKPSGIKFFLNVATKTTMHERVKTILNFTTNLLDEKKKEELTNQLSETYTKRPISKENQLRQLLSASLFKAPKRIDGDLLFLVGKKDRLVDYHCSVKLSQRFQAKVFIHEEAGHDLPLDDPEWILEKIHQW